MSGRALRHHHVPRFALECGAVLDGVRVAYHLDGALNAERDNLVVVFPALTGSADAAGDWWRAVIGPGRALDTRRHAVLCASLLGLPYGSTGPAEPERRPFPAVTPRDMARLVAALVDSLGVRSVALATGGSLGGMVALEWAASFPDRTRRGVVFAAPAAHTAAAIGWNHIQREAIRLAGPEAGLALARMIAMQTYRTPAEFEARFGREPREAGGYQIESYLAHQGRKLVDRFDAHSYLTLTGAMDKHDVGRQRGGVAAALAPVGARLVGVGIPGDRLYAAEEVRAWTRAAGAQYVEIDSVYGHDAFLLEPEQVGGILGAALETAEPTPLHTGATR
jgi:homoserine O-acetyltransferase/O-succinyltransferase